MINIDFENKIYVCPFCECKQSFENTYEFVRAGYHRDFSVRNSNEKNEDLHIYHIMCTNKTCSKVTVVARNIVSKKQFDINPQRVYKEFPDYIPQQIRCDYVEAVSIIQESPKASATLLRRCLQGMIRDFWNIIGKNLKDEIDELQNKVPSTQWKAIDGLRKIGNIGAHMEKDINLIIDIEKDEAKRLASLIELLMDKWYISRHDEEELYKNISDNAEHKKDQM